MPLQKADPKHQFGNVAGAGIQLQPEKLVRVHLVTVEAAQRLLAPKIDQRLQHLALQPLHQFQRHIEKIAGATGRVQHPRVVKLVVEIAHGLDCGIRIALQLLPLGSRFHRVPVGPSGSMIVAITSRSTYARGV